MEYTDRYINFLKTHIEVKKPLTIVFDASNGPAGMIVKNLYADTSIKSITINDSIDPDFSAHGPNPLLDGATDSCSKTIKENNADVGIIFDADGDRAIFIDDEGIVLPAYMVGILLGRELNPPYVADELVFESLRMLGIFKDEDLLPSRIGSFFVKENLRENKASFALEYSGHYYFKDFFNADSGIFAAIKVVNVLSKMEGKLSDLRKKYLFHEITTTEIKTEGKDMQEIYKRIEKTFTPQALKVEKIDGLTFIFDNFWINVRSSNTEPIMRIVSGGTKDAQSKIQEFLVLINE